MVAYERLPVDLPCFLCVPNSNQNVCEQAIIVWSFQRSDKVERLGEGQDSFLIVPVVVLIQRQLVLCLTSLLPTSCSHYRLLRPRTGARKMSTAAFFCSTSSRSTHMRASTHPLSFAERKRAQQRTHHTQLAERAVRKVEHIFSKTPSFHNLSRLSKSLCVVERRLVCHFHGHGRKSSTVIRVLGQ